MDLYKVLQDLYAEKGKLEQVIASLEEVQRSAEARLYAFPAIDAPKSQKKRGRKSLSATECQEVSVRMKKYWANRRVLRQQMQG